MKLKAMMLQIEQVLIQRTIGRPIVYAARLFWQFVLLCTDLTNEFLTKNGAQLAAAVSYYSLLSLIPLTLGLASILGFVLGSEETRQRIVEIVPQYLPVSQDYVRGLLDFVVKNRTFTGIIGLAGLLWPSMAVFGIIRKTVNFMWGDTRPRPFMKERLIDFILTIVGGILVVAPIVFTVLYSHVGDLLRDAGVILLPAEVLLRLAFPYISPVISFFIFLALYRYLPNTWVRYRDIWPGTLLVTAAFEANKWWFFWYARTFSIPVSVYGQVAYLMVLLGWIWVSADILLYGALAMPRVSPTMARKIEQWTVLLLRSLPRLKNMREKLEGASESVETLGEGRP